MLTKGMSREQIREYLKDKGNFVQIDHLNRFLETKPPIPIKRFVYEALTSLYEKANLLSDAGLNAENSAEACVTFTDKISFFVRATELFIKAGKFDRADYSMKKALHHANASEKGDVYRQIKEFYKKQAGAYEQEHKKAHAVKFYEKLLTMNLFEEERNEIKLKLADLYDKLGRFNDAAMLKKS